MCSCIKATPTRVRRSIMDDAGQALVEAPLVIVITCMMFLILVQPAIWLYTKALVSGAAGAACRIAATDDYGAFGDKAQHDITLKRWVITRRLTSLPSGETFRAQEPEVVVGGTGAKGWVTVTVSVKQRPLPLVGKLFASTVKGLDAEGLVTIKATTSAPGSLVGISKSQGDAAGVYGQPPEEE